MTEHERSDDGNQPQHYFAASPYRWHRARTREQAIENLRLATPVSELRQAIQHNGGLFLRTWLLDADMLTEYTVDPVTLLPVDVVMLERRDYRMFTIAGRYSEIPVPDESEPDPEPEAA